MLINCWMRMSVWKDYTFSQTCMSQATARGELFRDFRCSDVKLVDDHGPETHDSNSRCPMMGFIEQDHRKGKVASTKKKLE